MADDMAGDRAETDEAYAMVAQFAAEEEVVPALQALRSEGFDLVEAYGPLPSPAIEKALQDESKLVEIFALVCGIAGAVFTYGLLFYSSVWGFPFVVGDKPFHAWPPFLVITFAITALSVILGAFLAMLVTNRLPRLHHPIFNAEAHERAASDRWLVAVLCRDEQYDRDRLHELLQRFHPLSLEEVPS